MFVKKFKIVSYKTEYIYKEPNHIFNQHRLNYIPYMSLQKKERDKVICKEVLCDVTDDVLNKLNNNRNFTTYKQVKKEFLLQYPREDKIYKSYLEQLRYVEFSKLYTNPTVHDQIEYEMNREYSSFIYVKYLLEDIEKELHIDFSKDLIEKYMIYQKKYDSLTGSIKHTLKETFKLDNDLTDMKLNLLKELYYT